MGKFDYCSTVFDTRSEKWVVLYDKIQTEEFNGDTYWIACNDDDDALVIVRERDLSPDNNAQEEEPWTYWKLFYGRKNIATEFGQYIKCGDCGFEMPFAWIIPYGEERVLPTECPHCHLPVRIDQTCGGVKRR